MSEPTLADATNVTERNPEGQTSVGEYYPGSTIRPKWHASAAKQWQKGLRSSNHCATMYVDELWCNSRRRYSTTLRREFHLGNTIQVHKVTIERDDNHLLSGFSESFRLDQSTIITKKVETSSCTTFCQPQNSSTKIFQNKNGTLRTSNTHQLSFPPTLVFASAIGTEIFDFPWVEETSH